MEIKVIRLPGNTRTVMLPEGATVAEAVNMAEMGFESGETLKVDGQNATMDTVLRDGQKVYISKGAKGNG